MKKLTLVILSLLVANVVFGANSIWFDDNGTFPTTVQSPRGTAYISVPEGKKIGVSIKGSTFDSGSIDLQEAFINEAGVEEWQSISGKDAITAAEDFQFVAIGNKIRFVVTSVAAAGADVHILVVVQRP